MTDNKVTAFLPCRKGSERVTDKNTRPFFTINGGLIQLKLSQLVSCEKISTILVSTDDENVKKIANYYKKISNIPIEVLERPSNLALSSTSTDDIISHVKDIIKNGHILWTHVTSPFVDADIYDSAIDAYFKGLESKEYDSLMSVATVRKFMWDGEKPINYDRTTFKWPRTQTLNKVYEITSAIFISSYFNYNLYNDRIGIKPKMFDTNYPAIIDIDTEDDFLLAESVYSSIYSRKKHE